MAIETRLKDWAQKAVEAFNLVDIDYYQQSPLNCISKPVDTMVIGINPGSPQSEVHPLTAEEFMAGNHCWKERFETEDDGSKVSKKWAKYFGNAHYFMCGDQVRHTDGFDDDTKTVWTNLTPFATEKASQLKAEHYKVAIPKLLELIEILKPKKIVLLGTDTFNKISNQPGADVQREKVVKDTLSGTILEIGTINGTPAIQFPHPSPHPGKGWGFENYFLPVFFKVWDRSLAEKQSLKDCAAKMRTRLTRLALPEP